MSEQEGGGASPEDFNPERESKEQEEAKKFNEMVNEGKLTTAEVSQVEKDKTPEEVEVEKLQKDFEQLTKEGFQRFSVLEQSGRTPDELSDYADDIDVNKYGWGWKFGEYVTATATGYLLEAKNTGKHGDVNLDVNIPDMKVLEVGGYSSEEEQFTLSRLFKANYTGIDIETQEQDWCKPGSKNAEGKLDERLKLDVMNVDEALRGRQYDLIWGTAFIGYPTSSAAARESKAPRDYELSVIKKLDTLLRPGGLIVFLNSEQAHFQNEDIERLGLEVARNKIDNYEIIVIRKPGLFEKGSEKGQKQK